MKIKIDLTKSIQENATIYYDKAKKARGKIEGLKNAIEKTKEELKKAELENNKKINKKEKDKNEKSKWYEQFHWFFTINNRLCVGGKSATQNELIFKKYMEKEDLFFHADIVGGSVVILKDGINATDEEKRAAAQFAASFSRGWKMNYATLDVYSLRKEQLSKYSSGQFVGKGGIAMKGTREWFKSTPLKLKIGIEESETNNRKIIMLPLISKRKIKKGIRLYPGRDKKEIIAKRLAKYLKENEKEIIELLPPGKCATKID